jgi:hypothetical protein
MSDETKIHVSSRAELRVVTEAGAKVLADWRAWR